MGFFSKGGQLSISAGAKATKLLLISGKPLREPIVQYGPFVMNTVQQIDKAMHDYQIGRLVS